MKHIEVVAAIIISDNKILCVQRGESKYDYVSEKYEFPGGKVDENETREEAIIREIREELEIEIKIDKFFITIDHSYPDFKITMHCFICSTQNTNITLTEHIDFKWLTTHELNSLDWAEADIPAVKKLMAEL